MNEGLPPKDPNYQALSQLGKKLKGAVLIGHSQSGMFPFEAALLGSEGIKGLVAIEPRCNAAAYSDEQIVKLSRVPILVLFGDHLESAGFGINWTGLYADCGAFVARINAAKGNAILIHTVDLGIHGNTHMMMEDKNNLQIADLIIKWIGQHAL